MRAAAGKAPGSGPEKLSRRYGAVGSAGNHSRPDTAVMADAETVCIPTAPLPPGSYTVEYTVTADVGHRLTDGYAFTVVDGGAPVVPGACAPAAPTDPAAPGAAPGARSVGGSVGGRRPSSEVPVIGTASPRAAGAPARGWLTVPGLAVVAAVLGLVALGVVLVVRAR